MSRFQEEKLFTSFFSSIILAICCTALWGSAFPSIKIGYELFSIGDSVFNKILFAGCRFTGAGVLVFLFLCFTQKKVPIPKKFAVLDILWLSIAQTSLQYALSYIGLSHTTGVKGSIISGSPAFIAVIFAHFFYQNDKLNRYKAIGCIAGFAGVILINLDAGGIQGGFRWDGEGFLLLSAVSSSIAFVISKRATMKESPAIVTAYQLLIGGGSLILFGLLGGGKLPVVTWQGLLLLLYMAFLSAAAFVIWAGLLKYNPVGKISLFNFLTPVFGVALSGIFLGEQIWEWKNLVALVLVCSGIFIVNRIPAQKRSSL